MSGSTSVLDSLTPVAPPAGAVAAGNVPTLTVTAKAPAKSSATSILDSLPIAGGDNAQNKSAAPLQNEAIPDWAIHDQPQQPLNATLAAPKPSWSNILGAIPSGLYQGVAAVPNLPTNAINAVTGGINAMSPMGPRIPQLTPPINTNPTGYQPIGTAAQVLHDASSAAANTVALGGAAKMLTPLLPSGSAPAIASQAIEHTPPSVIAASGAGGAAEEPIAKYVPQPYQGLVRMGANVGVGGLTAGAEAALGRGMSGSVSPEAAQLAQLGRDTYDIPIRAGQISGNRLVRTADSALQSVPFSGHAGLDEEAQLAFNRATARTFGEDATKITPEVMNAARTRIGGVLQDVETRNRVNFDQPLINDLATIESGSRSSMTDPEFAVVKRQLDGVLSNVMPGDQISGTTYGNLIHKGSPLDAAANSANPNIAGYASQIKDALRGSLERSLSGDDLTAYQTARTQWKNMRTVEPLTLRADIVGGASPATGDIIPAQLRAVVNRSYGNSAFAEPGQIPLNDLANIGQRFLKESPTSQTSERSNFMRWIERAGALAGGLVGGEHYLGIPVAEMAVPAAVAGGVSLGVARGISAKLRGAKYAERLIDQGLNPQSVGQAAIGGAQNAGVPLLTSSGVRQLEPPQEQGPSINPQTGLQQFNLKDAQDEASPLTKARGIASQMIEGPLKDHIAVSNYISQNKRDLRGAFGGQGLQNIMLMSSLLRRAQGDPSAPATLLSALTQTTPSDALSQAMKNAGISDVAGFAALGIANPEFARTLAMSNSRPNLTKPGEARLISALDRAHQEAQDNEPRRRITLPGGNGVGASQSLRQGSDQSAPQVLAQITPNQQEPARVQ